jgi:hypothetical protein
MTLIEVLAAAAAASAIITDCIQNYQALSKPGTAPIAPEEAPKTSYKKTRAFTWTTEVKVGS